MHEAPQGRVHNRSKRASAVLDADMALAPPPFKFSARRTRIDWQTLHGVDIQQLVWKFRTSSNLLVTSLILQPPQALHNTAKMVF